jgi:hypothetical protein
MAQHPAQLKIELRRIEAAAEYPSLWAKMIAEWRADSQEDRAWLMYSANYLFRTANVRWAIDPLTLASRLPNALPVNSIDLQGLSFVLLTHSHEDHLALDLIRSLRHLPIRWVVPQPLLALVTGQAGLSPERILIPRFGETLTLDGLQITPFKGVHWRPGNPSVPTTAYQVSFSSQRWLFVGDTRTYDADLLPSFGSLDGLFAHLCLGSRFALEDEPPLLDSFCRFCLDLQPSRLVITHLEELGREAEDYWEERHCQKVLCRLQQLAPRLPVECAYMGESVIL